MYDSHGPSTVNARPNSVFRLETSALPDSIEQDVLVVTAGFPNSEAAETLGLNELALGLEALLRVVANQDLRGRVVDVRWKGVQKLDKQMSVRCLPVLLQSSKR